MNVLIEGLLEVDVQELVLFLFAFSRSSLGVMRRGCNGRRLARHFAPKWRCQRPRQQTASVRSVSLDAMSVQPALFTLLADSISGVAPAPVISDEKRLLSAWRALGFLFEESSR